MANSIEQCTRQNTKGDLAFSESGVEIHLLNSQRYECCKIQVDRCLPIRGVKCDWMVWYNHNTQAIFIELKGRKIPHAVEQLANTITWLRQNALLPAGKKVCYIVTSNRCPRTTGKTLLEKAKFKKHYSADLEIVRSGISAQIV